MDTYFDVLLQLDAFQADLDRARQPLEALAALGAASDQKNFYDNLHLSPLKVTFIFLCIKIDNFVIRIICT